MSAFEVDHAHIDALLTAGLRLGMPHLHNGPLRWLAPAPVNEHAYQRGEPWGPECSSEYELRRRELTKVTAGQVGAMLVAENRRSVDHRYDEEELEAPYEYSRFPRSIHAELKPAAILKAIDCYEYQSCEHPEWPSSEAQAFCHALRGAMCRALPGYDEAAWEITDR